MVELSISIVALAGLLAAIVPAARSARNADLSAQCRHNLGRIQQAALVYSAEDPNEQMIPIGEGDAMCPSSYTSPYGFGGRSGRGSALSFDQSPFSGAPQYLMGSMHRPLNALLYKQAMPAPPSVTGRSGTFTDWSFDVRQDLGVYRCPADAGFPGMHHKGWRDSGLTSYDYYGTSYAAPTIMIFADPVRLKSLAVYAHPTSAIPSPANTVAYLENAGRFAPLANNPALSQDGCNWPYSVGDQVAHGWHGVDFRFNTAHADGSVQNHSMQGYGLDPGVQCSPAFTVCACLAMRGSGWRIDISPAYPALTTKDIGGGGVTSDGTGDMWNIVQ